MIYSLCPKNMVYFCRQAFWLGKICPDMHLLCSVMATQPRVPWYSPVRHQLPFCALMEFWILLEAASGSAAMAVRSEGQRDPLSDCSKLFRRVSSMPPLLASLSKLPTFCNVPSAISMPSLAVSEATSAVVLISSPVE